MPGRKPSIERLSYNRDASTIRRLLTETHVAATDRRAIFVGAEAYTEAGGTILRDLFTEDRGGYFEDVALLDLLVTWRNSGARQTPYGGRGLEMDGSPSRTSRTPTVCAGLIRIRSSFRRKIRPPLMLRRPNSTA